MESMRSGSGDDSATGVKVPLPLLWIGVLLC